MGLFRRSGARDVVELGDSDDTVYVVSPRAAEHAVKAEKENRRAARAERRLAESRAKAVKGGGQGGDDGDRAPEDESALRDPLTSAKVKRYLGIARILVPVVAPLVYQAVSTVRSQWDTHRARQLGVAPDELADFTGRGAALYARIHNLALSARDLRSRHGDVTTRSDGDRAREIRTFVEDADTRLTDLEAAVRAAEQMPASRRRSAHIAVAGELDRIETRLLVLWGVGGPRPLRAADAADAADAGDAAGPT